MGDSNFSGNVFAGNIYDHVRRRTSEAESKPVPPLKAPEQGLTSEALVTLPGVPPGPGNTRSARISGVTGNSKKRSRKTGPTPRPEHLLRTHCVSVRLSKSELAWLDSARGNIKRGEYLRNAAMGKLPPVVPAINQKAWTELATVMGTMATIAKRIRSDQYVGMQDNILFLVSTLRNKLIGASK